MKRLPIFLLVGGATLLAGRQFLRHGGKRRLDFAAMRRRMMERMMQAMPEDSPPKLITSILPRLQEQNDQVLTLLKEQNELLRKLERND
jgi:hypothetical protein